MELHPATVFKELVAKMNFVWFDLFRALGMEHKTLEGIRQLYPCDPNISLFEAISEWLKGGGPGGQRSPNWESLVHTLRQDMLEAKLADAIAEKHFSAQQLENYKSKIVATSFLS